MLDDNTSECSSDFDFNSIEPNLSNDLLDNPKTPSLSFCYEVQFKCTTGNFLSDKIFEIGDYVAVEGDRGYNVGVICKTNIVDDFAQLRILHKFSDNLGEIKSLFVSKIVAENAALVHCQEFCHGRRIGLFLETISAEFQFDRKKLTIYIQKSGVVSVCKLVRKLYDTFKMRISVEEVSSTDEVTNMMIKFLNVSQLHIPLSHLFHSPPLVKSSSPLPLPPSLLSSGSGAVVASSSRIPSANTSRNQRGKKNDHQQSQNNGKSNNSLKKLPTQQRHQQNPSLVQALQNYMPPRGAHEGLDDLYRHHHHHRKSQQEQLPRPHHETSLSSNSPSSSQNYHANDQHITVAVTLTPAIALTNTIAIAPALPSPSCSSAPSSSNIRQRSRSFPTPVVPPVVALSSHSKIPIAPPLTLQSPSSVDHSIPLWNHSSMMEEETKIRRCNPCPPRSPTAIHSQSSSYSSPTYPERTLPYSGSDSLFYFHTTQELQDIHRQDPTQTERQMRSFSSSSSSSLNSPNSSCRSRPEPLICCSSSSSSLSSLASPTYSFSTFF